MDLKLRRMGNKDAMERSEEDTYVAPASRKRTKKNDNFKKKVNH